MSLRNRKRLLKRTEIKSVPGPRVARSTLSPYDRVMRVRIPTTVKTLDSTPRRLRRVAKVDPRVIDSALESFRRQHIVQDIRNSRSIDFDKYQYARINVGKLNESVLLPAEHPLCKEREERREVLFAKNKAGKGGGKQKPPKIPKIDVKCIRR